MELKGRERSILEGFGSERKQKGLRRLQGDCSRSIRPDRGSPHLLLRRILAALAQQRAAPLARRAVIDRSCVGSPL